MRHSSAFDPGFGHLRGYLVIYEHSKAAQDTATATALWRLQTS
ncbi:MAG TPA: hypothetical protein VND96_14395 [Candidatus Micrarchaeaceae archaeon]|nr:hypothetical protein [Candidatus Micrarchaeaceae archaeon]